MIRYVCKDCKEDFIAHPNAEDCPYCESKNVEPVFNSHYLEDKE